MVSWRIINADVREGLATLPDESVQCVVTSPPYWGLRDYGVDGQLGLEETPQEFLDQMVAVFREVRRVLRSDGVCWVNMGDSYNANTGSGFNGNAKRPPSARETKMSSSGLAPKNLMGMPWRLAFAMQADGWWLRSDCIWHKPNPMPESVTDRPTKSHEYVFLMTKAERYFYDADAVRQKGHNLPASYNGARRVDSADRKGLTAGTGWQGSVEHPNGANLRTVWTIPAQPYAGAHFATFPEALAERCIRAASRVGDTVLDPFTGSGTTGAVAVGLGRSFVGTELNPEYVRLARKRIGAVAPLLAKESTG